jgi:multidrug resistance efflux pump
MKNHLSEEILDILNESPRWVVRMGATVIMFLLLLFLAGTWFIRYPEVLKGAVLVTTAAPTLKVVSEGEGRMMRLLVTNGSMVRKGDVLAEMENRTRLENTPMLQNLLRETQLFLQNPKRSIQLPNDSLSWGDLQANVSALSQHYLDFKRLQTDEYHELRVSNLKQQIAALHQLQQVNKRKKDLNLEAFRNASDGYQTDQKLFSEGIYSRTEFQKKENEYLGKRREQEDYAENMIKNDLKITEIEAELKTVEYAFLEKQRFHLAEMAMAVRNIENGLRNWQEQYLILAPSDGRLAYLQNLAENQFVKAGETLFAIKPAQEDFVAMVDIPVRGMGKAKVGQTVILKLDDYPFQEFGTIEGKVVSMAPSTDVKTYRMMVALPNGLRSSYHRDFVCKSEMAGSVEIITDDMRLFERAFYGIRKLVM